MIPAPACCSTARWPKGYSNPRPIPVNDEEQLVNEAFGNAAFNAVKQISKFNLPVATVLIGRDTNSVTLNKGTRDGLYNGLDMLVTRNGVVTGRIRVSDASNNDANATITDQGSGIRPEDRATALYTLPAYTINHSTGHLRRPTVPHVGGGHAFVGDEAQRLQRHRRHPGRPAGGGPSAQRHPRRSQ